MSCTTQLSLKQPWTHQDALNTHCSSCGSFLSALRAMHWKASSTFRFSLALVSKQGMLPFVPAHCRAFLSDTCT